MNKRILRAESVKRLQARQDGIEYEGPEDTAAWEYHGEIQALIDVLTDSSKSDASVMEVAADVGLEPDLVWS